MTLYIYYKEQVSLQCEQICEQLGNTITQMTLYIYYKERVSLQCEQICEQLGNTITVGDINIARDKNIARRRRFCP